MIKDLHKAIYKYKTFIAVSTVIIVLLSISIIPRNLYTTQTLAASFGGGHSDPNNLNSVIGKFGSSSSQSGFGSNTVNSQPSSSDTIKQFTGLSKASDPNGISDTQRGHISSSNGGNANGGNANGGTASGNNGNAHSSGSGSATGGSGNGNNANGGTGGAGGTGGNGGTKYSNTASLSGGSSFN